MALTERYVSSLAGGAGTGASEASPYTFTQMVTEIKSVTGTGGQGKRYNVKADGTYTRSAYDDIGGSGFGSYALPVVIRGYKTVIGDGWLGRTNGNGPVITTNMPLITYTNAQFRCGRLTILESLHFQGANENLFLEMESNCGLFGLVVRQTGSNSDAATARLREANVAHECDFLCTATSGPNLYVVRSEQPRVRLDSCRIITASPTQGGWRAERSVVAYGCLLKGAGGGAGIIIEYPDHEFTIRNNTFAGWQDGIKCTITMEWMGWIVGNMFTDNTGYGLNYSGNGMVLVGPNRLRDNVSGNINDTNDWIQSGRLIPHVTTDTGGPETDYINASSNDYTLISASPGKDSNRPSYSDMGAFGVQNTGSGGGGTAVFNPLAQTIIRPA